MWAILYNDLPLNIRSCEHVETILEIFWMFYIKVLNEAIVFWKHMVKKIVLSFSQFNKYVELLDKCIWPCTIIIIIAHVKEVRQMNRESVEDNFDEMLKALQEDADLQVHLCKSSTSKSFCYKCSIAKIICF